MHHHRFTGALAALVVAGALVSCAADAQPPASGEREGKGKAAREQRDHAQQRAKKKAAEPGQAKPGKPRASGSGSVGAPAGGSSGGSGSASAPTSGAPATSQAAPKPSCTDDASGDLEGSGSAPAYADTTGGCLRPDGSRLRLEATTAAPAPARMPDRDTQLSYGFELTSPSGSTIYVHAQASTSGWTAYLSRGNSQREIGAPVVDGDRVVLSLPLAELGPARTFQWKVESSWLRSGVLSTQYAFDAAPNVGAARFDR